MESKDWLVSFILAENTLNLSTLTVLLFVRYSQMRKFLSIHFYLDVLMITEYWTLMPTFHANSVNAMRLLKLY